MCSVWVCGVCCWCFVGVCGCGASHTLKITAYTYILMYMSGSLFAHFLREKQHNLEHLLSTMSAFFEAFDLPRWFHVFCFSLLFQALLDL